MVWCGVVWCGLVCYYLYYLFYFFYLFYLFIYLFFIYYFFYFTRGGNQTYQEGTHPDHKEGPSGVQPGAASMHPSIQESMHSSMNPCIHASMHPSTHASIYPSMNKSPNPTPPTPSQMKGICHDNLNIFVGASVDPPHICLVWYYCPKGSVQVEGRGGRGVFWWEVGRIGVLGNSWGLAGVGEVIRVSWLGVWG